MYTSVRTVRPSPRNCPATQEWVQLSFIVLMQTCEGRATIVLPAEPVTDAMTGRGQIGRFVLPWPGFSYPLGTGQCVAIAVYMLME